MNIYSQIFPYASLLWGCLSFTLLLVAWWSAARGRTGRHRALMIFLTAGAWLFISSYLLRYSMPGYAPIEIPREYIPWIAFHGTVGLIPLFGSALLVWARVRGRSASHLNRHHRCYGRFLVPVWGFSHLGGILNFWLFY